MKQSKYVSIEELVCVIKDISNDIIICGHKNSDYDSMCSSLALAISLKQLKKNVKVYIEPESIDKIEYFNCNELLCDNIDLSDYTFIALDLNRISRLPDNMEKCYKNANLTINIDHHNENTTNADFILSNCEISSTCEIIYNLLKKMKININKKISELIFTGIVSDTNLFSNTTSSKTFSIVSSLLKKKIDNEFLIKKFYLEKSQEELKIIAYIIDNLKYDNIYYVVLNMKKFPFNKVSYSDISKNCIPVIMNDKNIDILMVIMDYGNKKKGEIRSKNNVDVSKLASLLTGGGHTHAAGFSNNKSLKEIIDICKKYLKDDNYGS